MREFSEAVTRLIPTLRRPKVALVMDSSFPDAIATGHLLDETAPFAALEILAFDGRVPGAHAVIADRLVEYLTKGYAVVRGQIKAGYMHQALKNAGICGKSRTISLMRLTRFDHEVGIAPVTLDETQDVDNLVGLVDGVLDVLRLLGVRPNIAVVGRDFTARQN